jgi:hypothetical protein
MRKAMMMMARMMATWKRAEVGGGGSVLFAIKDQTSRGEELTEAEFVGREEPPDSLRRQERVALVVAALGVEGDLTIPPLVSVDADHRDLFFDLDVIIRLGH